MKVSIIEYGIGNIQSVVNVCRKLGYETNVAQSGAQLLDQKPQRIILPGVGAVGYAMQSLEERGMTTVLTEQVLGNGIPFLGICVGMQILATKCIEFGTYKGLDWISGEVSRIAPIGSGVLVPHVGWNTLHVANKNDPIFGVLDGQDVYFVHSQVMRCDDSYVIAVTDYNGEFISAVKNKNIYGVQFHPEKSSYLGEQLISHFVGCSNVEA